MTDEEKRKALAAAGILQSEAFMDAMAKLDARYVAAWRSATGTEQREDCWHRQALLKEVEAELYAALQSAAVTTCGKDEEITAALKTVRAKRGRKNG